MAYQNIQALSPAYIWPYTAADCHLGQQQDVKSILEIVFWGREWASALHTGEHFWAEQYQLIPANSNRRGRVRSPPASSAAYFNLI